MIVNLFVPVAVIVQFSLDSEPTDQPIVSDSQPIRTGRRYSAIPSLDSEPTVHQPIVSNSQPVRTGRRYSVNADDLPPSTRIVEDVAQNDSAILADLSVNIKVEDRSLFWNLIREMVRKLSSDQPMGEHVNRNKEVPFYMLLKAMA